MLTERIAGTDYDRTHVMMESTLGGEKRLSSGVGTDIVEAFWEAVQDAVSDKIKNAPEHQDRRRTSGDGL